jgi:hypothetical protein
VIVKLLKFLFLSTILSSSLALAQHRYEVASSDVVLDVAKQVEKLVERHEETIPTFELNRIYRDLNRIVNTFDYYGLDLVDDIPQRVCNGRDMVELDGNLFHTFAFSSDCREALSRANSGKPLCYQGLMIDAYGTTIHKFTFSSDCVEALEYVEAEKYFCDGKVLYSPIGERTQSFPFGSDCRSARDQINAN